RPIEICEDDGPRDALRHDTGADDSAFWNNAHSGHTARGAAGRGDRIPPGRRGGERARRRDGGWYIRGRPRDRIVARVAIPIDRAAAERERGAYRDERIVRSDRHARGR